MGTLAGSLCEDMNVSLSLGSVLLITFMLFSGLYANSSSIPVWIGWIQYITPTFYGFKAAAMNEYTGLTFPECPSPLSSPCSAQYAIDELSFSGAPSIALSFIILVAIFVVLTAMYYFALMRLAKRKGGRAH